MATYITNLFKNTTVKYLCVKPLDKMEFWSLNFHCMPFETYEEADNYYNKQYNSSDAQNCKIERSTIMPVCKFVPAPLHPMILNYKLSKLFINAEVYRPMRF
jgi:hypothetical protein